MTMNAHIRAANIARFTRDMWLAGYSLEAVARSCQVSGATEAEVGAAVDIYIAEDLDLSLCEVTERGAHLDRRAS